MTPQDQLRAVIERRISALSSSIPADGSTAILALIRAIDCTPSVALEPGKADPFTGMPAPSLGASRALHLILGCAGPSGLDPDDFDTWSKTFLGQCRDIARAELVLAHVEIGFMRLTARPDGGIDAHIAQRHPPERWRERADDVWWSYSLEVRRPIAGESPIERANSLVSRLAHRYDLTPNRSIDGIRIALVHGVLAALLVVIDIDDCTVREGNELAIQVSRMADAGTAEVAAVLEALTLVPGNASWHAAVPGIADPPLVLLPDGRIAMSRRGLTRDPFRFVTRELRRRAPDPYHNAAAGREAAFRTDLYALFQHRRFVSSAKTIALRGERGSLRTDVDAAVFDRKTGTLALFELKTHEPFARSTEEMQRRRENMHAASRQVAGTLDWINRHGANEILNRFDRDTARQFRVQKVLPFVLGRYVIDSPPHQRATWASWPQVLRSLDGRHMEELGGNPIASLATRLQQDTPLVSPHDVTHTSSIDLGEFELQVHPRR